uniref:Uncharacterized protein n=1 Tax=Tanacetum cinerariifolium TaxID=118510 RepID=A0A6L2LZ29_TANCI|nr:hypothetical protein [Tanacetum cinerariifolium]
MPKTEKYVTESLGAELLVRSTNQPQMAYAVYNFTTEFELKKILIDKMKANESINRSDNQKNLYNALVKSYNSDKDIITSYGDVGLLKRGQDDQDKDEDPFAGSDRGMKRKKSSKDVESSKDSRRKRLMRTDELHKFSDGTLNDVRTALRDFAAGIRMEYLPMRKWSNLEKKRSWVMVQDIDKQLYQRRLMRNLEMFVGGRIYRKDLRLLERTI